MQQAEERATIFTAQGHLQQVEHHLQGEVELQRRQRDAMVTQGEAQDRELAHFRARLQAERAALAKEHEEQKRAVQEREQCL
uniref:Uncharacterized protein n=1 Tax=Hyaloperonospora arabidopsidis (strain Emoy2) TaxID=559515 RepID=M4BZP3_HYAAE